MTPSLLDVRFLLLLLLVCGLRHVWPTRFYSVFGAAASALLIAIASPETFVVITCLTLFYVYPLHRVIQKAKRTSYRRAKGLCLVGIIGLAGLLVAYKVYTAAYAGGDRDVLAGRHLFALVGFSYFLFRAISFLHIQLIGDIEEFAPWTLLFYFSFPPTLTSGPIQKFQDFRLQSRSPVRLTVATFSRGIYRITRGFFRKLVLAVLANGAVEWLLSAPVSNAYVSVAVLATLFLYFYLDFAGYSDIAIGFGLLLGIVVPENFKRPFLATSVTEFWRNWHITLVDWFRDQVFIPLGGMSGSRRAAGGLAFLIMVLCGLWHGLTYSFVLWGVWHGAMLFLEAMLGSKPLPPSQRAGFYYWIRVAWTNARVAFGTVFFLPDLGTSMRILRGLLTWV